MSALARASWPHETRAACLSAAYKACETAGHHRWPKFSQCTDVAWQRPLGEMHRVRPQQPSNYFVA
eukprot:351697-Chlamydomonas_euryale.AAC.4